MIVNKNGEYFKSRIYPNSNWLGDDYFIIDETTSTGRVLVQRYEDNHPFVDFEYEGEHVTKIIVLEEEKGTHDQLQQEIQVMNKLKPSIEEIWKAETEIQILTILYEIGVL